MNQDPSKGVYNNVKINAKAFFVCGAKRFSLNCPSCKDKIIIDHSVFHENPQIICHKCNKQHKILGTKWFTNKVIFTLVKEE